jgi:DNA invertase Pin-like site-specific DNA recombinase
VYLLPARKEVFLKMADNKLTILYSRLSREDENNSGESLSIENQKKLLEEYAVQNGFVNIRHFYET